MASLTKQNGTYYAQFYDSSRSQNRKRLSLKTSDKSTARRLIGRMEDAYALGEYDPWEDERRHEIFGWEGEPNRDLSTIGEAKEAYLDSCDHLRPETQRTYKEVLRLFVRHVGDGYPTRKIGASDVEDWLRDDLANATKRKYVKHVGYLFRWLMEEGWMEEDHSKEVDLPDKIESTSHPLRRVHQRKLIRAIQQHHQNNADDGRFKEYHHLIRVVRLNPMMGLRASEIINMKWGDRSDRIPMTVDLDARKAYITNTENFTTKPGDGRVIPLSESAVNLLLKAKERRPEGCPYVYHDSGSKLKYSALSHAFCRFKRKAELPEWIELHSTRHAYGTRLAEAGTPIHTIKRFMGHSTTEVTEQYMHAHPDQGHHYVDQAFG